MGKKNEAPPINYTKLFPPIKDWYEKEEELVKRVDGGDKHENDRRSQSYWETKKSLSLMPNKISEEEQQNISAICAGAPRPEVTFGQILKMVKTNVDYASNKLRKWREDSEYFADYCNHPDKTELQDMKQLGLSNHWETAIKQVSSEGTLKQYYRAAKINLRVMAYTQQVELQQWYARGRGKQSYIDFVLAGLCRIRDSNNNPAPGDFAHYLLEFEQAVIADPTLSNILSDYVQMLIGERAMSHDMEANLTLFFSFDAAVTPNGDEERMTPAIAKAMWMEYQVATLRRFGKTIDELLGLTEFLKKPKPNWNLKLHDTSFPVTDTPIGTSGHNYIRQRSPLVDVKRKTRGFADPDQVHLDTSRTDSVGSHSSFSDKAGTSIFKVTNKQMKLAKKLFSKADEQPGQSQVRWDAIVNLMKRIGFQVDGVGGSIVKFVPPNEAGIPFIEHRPHPENRIAGIRYRAFGQGLTERYGWTLDWFERVTTEEE
ncbi:uncharacterized protein L201_005299 [Kwoniella dendrophila CBS 6074]|uniref:Uncharacterized protein n=1 Tax=Kwoniella dendrophila CBS 6074 TaxID=1295534 RepID=A0AAX4JYR7_9TREE